ncbi:MAG: hypothetical protein C4576_24250 [Desulfobacteraceae bacterium]|nr:MAG: hypothetical protein C4576_24250 [Desulfobacteraceae bacterium]
MILITFGGCAALREIERTRKARESLIAARELLAKKDYSGSLKESQKALSLADRTPPADEALFNTGLVHAHFGHAKKEYKKPIEVFKRVLNEFPHSPFAGQAAIWIQVLQDMEKSRGEVEELNKAVRESKQENQRLIKEIEELHKTISTSKRIDIEIDKKIKELSK